jgi:tetratricopeptide (TPR) repeat protein
VNYIGGMSQRLATIALVLGAALAGCGSWHDMRAQNAYLQGRLDQAEEHNEAALARDPTDLDARRLGAKIATKRGVAALDQNDVPRARAYFDKAVKLNPTDGVAQDYVTMVAREQPPVTAQPPVAPPPAPQSVAMPPSVPQSAAAPPPAAPLPAPPLPAPGQP